MPVRISTRLVFVAAAALVIQACGGDSGTEPAPTPGSLTAAALVSTGTVGTPVAGSPAVTLRDTKGKPLAGRQVTFTVSAGGGSVTQGAATTDANGVATAGSWTLGTQPGVNTLQASAGTFSATFTVTASPDVPASIAAQAANPTSGVVGLPLAPAPAVVVKDRFSNPVPGVVVTFAAGTGSGSVSAGAATTDAAGVASTGWTLGAAAGTQTLTASAAGLATTLSATARAAAATALQAAAGATQTGTAGVVVATLPAVRAVDAFGNPVSGVAVTFAVTSGGGSLTGATQTTNTAGVATLGGWTLGTVAGANTLTASAPGLPVVTFSATGNAGAAAKLEKLAGDGQTAALGGPVPVAPSVRVRDAFDNAVAGASVTFTALAGTATGSPALTNASGVATLQSWTLGASAGVQQLEAKIGAISVLFSATAVAGNPPASAQAAAGNAQSAVVNSAVAVRPAVIVRDAQSNALPGITVTFAVAAGGGSVTGATAVTEANGVATVGGWTLGTVAGANRLTATVSGLGAVTFDATALAGAPAALAKENGDAQSHTAGAVVGIAPTVRVRDQFGNDVSGATVTFAVAAGGGAISGATRTTNANGLAAVGGWALGTTAGENRLSATVAGAGTVTFTAIGNAPQPSAFTIEVRYVGEVAATHRAAVDAAVARWQDVIRGDLSNVGANAGANACGMTHPAINETIDDLVIFAQIDTIDGAGQVLGQAGPCLIRMSNSLPALGVMKFDEMDLDNMAANGTLNDVILHEIGHILGIGTIWEDQFLLTGAGGSDPFFSGISSMLYFTFAGGAIAANNGVPVENTGSSGTRDSHWRESVLRTELMTGWISPAGVANPMSAITIASLADLGYDVNFAAANAYVVPALGFGMGLREAGEVELIEKPLPRPRRIPGT